MSRRNLYITLLALLVSILAPIGMITYTVTATNQNSNKALTVDTSNWDSVTKSFPVEYIMTEEEFELFQATMEEVATFKDYQDYVANAEASKSYSETPIFVENNANTELYKICDKYFQCYYGEQRVSPLLPMAIANVETPHRADFNKTWSALFPSKYVDTSRMLTFNVKDVVTDENIYKILSDDYSTRDRGALQMSPSYGTGDKEVNKLMSGNEVDKLKTVDVTGKEYWVSGASSDAGDRFHLPDMLLRSRVYFTVMMKDMLAHDYLPTSQEHLIAMLGVCHNGGYIWHYDDHSRKIGCWHSGQLAYDFTEKVSSPQFIEILQKYADNNDRTYIDTKIAKDLYSMLYSDSLSDYVTKDFVACYPIKLLYSYIKLYDLYTG